MGNNIFEINPWKLITHQFNVSEIRLLESLTSLGNGAFGMRGNFEEGISADNHLGTYIAGVWFPDKTRVGWWKNGYPLYFGKVINAFNFAYIHININGKKIDLSNCKYDDFSLELDMQNGLLSRQYRVLLPEGTVCLKFRRFLSIVDRRLAHFCVEVETHDEDVEISFESAIDADVYNLDSNYNQQFWEVIEKDEKSAFIQTKTIANSFGIPRFTISAMMENTVSIPSVKTAENNGKKISEKVSFVLKRGEHAVFEKKVAVVTNRDYVPEDHKQVLQSVIDTIEGKTFEELLTEQSAAWQKRWGRADVEICGDIEAQQGIRFNMFQLFSTYYGEDERLNIGPKGFTGEKYGGATYWDTEAFILPMYLSVADQVVNEKFLKYRYNQLSGALHNAAQQGLSGALYPMVTFTGIECHNEWEITFEEIHRNGAIAYAVYNYTNYTGDEEYLKNFGIDVLVEISRFWASRVHFSSEKNQYMIHGVTGPNEYENNVNNNWYTNFLCRWTFEYTIECLGKFNEKKGQLHVTEEEISRWVTIRDNMRL